MGFCPANGTSVNFRLTWGHRFSPRWSTRRNGARETLDEKTVDGIHSLRSLRGFDRQLLVRVTSSEADLRVC